MTIEDKIRSVLGYRTLPTTTLLVLIYAIALTAVFSTSGLGSVPHASSKKLRGFDLRKARRDLEHIAGRPHPYNSHANDDVRKYILNRLDDIAWGRDHIHLDDDLRSNGSWASTNYGVYFEGTNLLLKIDGTDTDLMQGDSNGVLFSAHYDSVSTAPGATDDGMGVTTLLQLAEYFAQNRPKRTAIFNINNGEEDWLNGAHAFMQHSWSNLTSTFLNLEGAAAGGQPILFRATSLLPLKAYDDVPHQLRVRHPHANVLSSDAFARGVIKSGTDYSVYTGNDRHGPAAASGLIMEGLDVAFYKGRSRYHTKWDGPAYTEGGDKSLWSMIDVARGVGVGLLNPKGSTTNADSKPGVYLDLFRSTLVYFSLKSVLVFNIIILIVGPIVLALLWAVSAVIHQRSTPPPPPPKPRVPHSSFSPSASASHHNASGRPPARAFGSSDAVPPASPTLLSRIQSLSAKNILLSIWKQASFWIALIVTVLLQGLLVWGYVALNPFTIHSRPYLVLLSFFSLAYLSVTLILRAAFPPAIVKHTTEVREKEKTTILLHLHLLTWVALLLGTIVIGKAQIGGVYTLTVWYIGVWGASVAGTLQAVLTTTKTDKGKKRARRSSSASSSDSSSSSSDSEDEPTPTVPNSERSPLLGNRGNGSTNNRSKAKDGDEGGAIGWWIVQILLTVPGVVLLVGQIGVLLLDAMSQTLSDGSSAWTVYASTSAIAVLLALPLAPFSPKLHRGLTIVALITFIAATAFLFLVFPFTSADPLKVFFQQRITLDHGDVFVTGLGSGRIPGDVALSASNSDPKIVTQITGTAAYLKQVISYLPSSREENLECTPNKLRPGLLTCEWESKPLSPYSGGRDPWYALNENTTSTDVGSNASWLKADLTRTGWTSARIVLQGRNTRNCRIYFDPPKKSGVKVVRYVVEGGSKGMQSGYPVDQTNGLKEIRLWSRTWDRVWEVDVDWETPLETGDEEGQLSGSIACEWAEYQSGMVDNGSLASDKQARIPALEEALSFLPEWAVVTKAADGLVEASVPFTL
ncbi:putative zinc metalloprotease [Coprinopsis marcescibilis]|uniref:Peptide hydrolase n=1 Tax=Coprinopsis marcescibilis TaxID=230819 RepID=A0A5C3KNX3_COPMA|nr:putative zinc metalloprotease [Coprinopsis marcescibilis]